ncbi:TPA: hypothetical protein PXN96_004279 [Yersinia enterocolitica]|nr:hypothetical protein [Yersinia enterocolitica]
MRKLLDSFTDERLKELSVEEDLYNFPPTQEELNSLARIALAAKRAEPEWYVVITSVGVWQARYKTRSEAENHIKQWNQGYWIKEIYTTPQFNFQVMPSTIKISEVVAAVSLEQNKKWTGRVGYMAGWNACRDTMLAAAPESNHD